MKRYMRPPPQYQLILASQSPRRKHLLAEAGIYADDVIAADIDETPKKNERPADYVLRMAQQKANAVASLSGGQFVLSADTAVICRQRILPKAETSRRGETLSSASVREQSSCLWRYLFVFAGWRMANKTVCQPCQVQTVESHG